MKNPFSYSSLSSYCSDNPSNDSKAFKYSRALTELQVSMHVHLTYNALSPTSKLSKQAQLKHYFFTQSNLSTLKMEKRENPFIYTKPYKFTNKQHYINKPTKGLTKWEKKQYLQQYRKQNFMEEKDQLFTINNKQQQRLDERREQEHKPSKKVQNRNAYMQNQGPRETKTFKSALNFQKSSLPQKNNEQKVFKDEYSFSHDIQLTPLNPYKNQNNQVIKQKIFQQPSQSNGFNFKKESRAKIQFHQNQKSDEQQRRSIIHRLNNQRQVKFQANMGNSNVQEFKIKQTKQQAKLSSNNSSNKKEELHKVKQVESNLHIQQYYRKPSLNPIKHEQYPKQIIVNHERYELINIL